MRKDSGREIKSGWKTDVPLEIVKHNEFQVEEIRQRKIVFNKHIELRTPAKITFIKLLYYMVLNQILNQLIRSDFSCLSCI